MVEGLEVPPLNHFGGEYGFSVIIQGKGNTIAGPSWLMSDICNKLYTSINNPIPFHVRLEKRTPKEKSFFIRAAVVFSSTEHLLSTVTRCPDHSSDSCQTNHLFRYPEHVLRADHHLTRYEKSPDGCLSLVLPLENLDCVINYPPILLRLMCLSSCIGGISQRPIAIKLTLESVGGRVYGRYIVNVLVSEKPEKDCYMDEQVILNRNMCQINEQISKPKYLDNQMFTIHVQGKQLYNLLTGIAETYMKTHPDLIDLTAGMESCNYSVIDRRSKIKSLVNMQISAVSSSSSLNISHPNLCPVLWQPYEKCEIVNKSKKVKMTEDYSYAPSSMKSAQNSREAKNDIITSSHIPMKLVEPRQPRSIAEKKKYLPPPRKMK